jgi:hypothetical protein
VSRAINQPNRRPGTQVPEVQADAVRRRCETREGLLLALLIVLGVLCGHTPVARAAEVPSLEYKVKAAYLYNFAKFVEWPSKKFPEPESPIVIGIVGEDPFGSVLEETVKGKVINGRKIIIRRLARSDELRQCHLLFISRSLREELGSLLPELEPDSVLTISEIQKFAQRGGMINFTIVNESVKCEINLEAAERAGLKISSKLSSVAKVVKTETD